MRSSSVRASRADERLAARGVVGVARGSRSRRPRAAPARDASPRGSQTTRARRVAKLTLASDDPGLAREPGLDQPDARAAVNAFEQQRHVTVARRASIADERRLHRGGSSHCDHSSLTSRSSTGRSAEVRCGGRRTRRVPRRRSSARSRDNRRSRSSRARRAASFATARAVGLGVRSGSNSRRRASAPMRGSPSARLALGADSMNAGSLVHPAESKVASTSGQLRSAPRLIARQAPLISINARAMMVGENAIVIPLLEERQMYKNLLVATDGSKLSDKAVDACDRARAGASAPS